MNHHCRRVFGAAVSACVLVVFPLIGGSPVAWADPAASADPADPADLPVADVAVAAAAGSAPAAADAGDAVGAACKQFGAALNVAAANYEDFAYATAGNGNYVNYQDPTVGRSNVVGRTALREAAAAALSASHTPGLPQEVSDPMQSWSLHATKLLVVMGLHGGGDSLNSSANQLNVDAHDAQLACALGGARA